MVVTNTASDAQSRELARYLRLRWRFPAVCCASAVLLAGAAGLVLPKQYTATASLMIEPPAGMDPRSATALSPVYLESLKTYESLASSDTLFADALRHLRLRERYPGRSLESLKRSVLRVNKTANTRVIEISVHLADPVDAQELAAYIAGQAATLNKTIEERSAAGTAKEAQAILQRARELLEAQRKRSQEFTSSPEAAQVKASNLAELKFGVDRDEGEAQAELAALNKEDPERAAAVRAKVAELDRQSRALAQQAAAAAQRAERFRERRESLDADLKAARIGFESAKTKLDDIESSAGFRGERLEVLDAGIVPQRPSFPNTPLNVVVAFLISLTASLGYLAFCFGLERSRFDSFR